MAAVPTVVTSTRHNRPADALTTTAAVPTPAATAAVDLPPAEENCSPPAPTCAAAVAMTLESGTNRPVIRRVTEPDERAVGLTRYCQKRFCVAQLVVVLFDGLRLLVGAPPPNGVAWTLLQLVPSFEPCR